jgi:hypothetical protein
LGTFDEYDIKLFFLRSLNIPQSVLQYTRIWFACQDIYTSAFQIILDVKMIHKTVLGKKCPYNLSRFPSNLGSRTKSEKMAILRDNCKVLYLVPIG